MTVDRQTGKGDLFLRTLGVMKSRENVKVGSRPTDVRDVKMDTDTRQTDRQINRQTDGNERLLFSYLKLAIRPIESITILP